MNKNSNLGIRQTSTKEKIKAALLELMTKKDLTQITVSELCKKAGVNRTSFYNNYSCTNDVLKEYASEYFSSAFDKAYKMYSESKEKSTDFNLEVILSYMKENVLFSNIILSDKNYLSKILEKSLPDFHKVIKDLLSKIKDERMKVAAETFLLKGFEGVLYEWLNNENEISAKDEAENLLKLTGTAIAGFSKL